MIELLRRYFKSRAHRTSPPFFLPVAQLDSARDSDSRGRRFESYRVGQNKKPAPRVSVFVLVYHRGQPSTQAKPSAVGSHIAPRYLRACEHTLSGRPKNTAEKDTFSAVFFYPLRKQWHIIAVGVYHHRRCISSAVGCIFFRNDDILV